MNNFTKIKPEETIELIAKKYQEILDILDLKKVVELEHLKDTPMRVSKMMVNELFSGCYNPPPPLKSFVAKKSAISPVFVKNITVKSLCAHHFVPFYGNATIYYTPNTKLCGLSKFSRVTNYFCRRPQIQEILTNQIGNYLVEQLNPCELIVAIRAKHLCMIHRGAEEHESLTDTIFTFSQYEPHKFSDSLLTQIYNSLPEKV